MSKTLKMTVFTLVFLLTFTSFALFADNIASSEPGQVLEIKSPGNPVETQKKFVRESDLRKMRGVLYSQIADTIAPQGFACQIDSVYPINSDICDDIMPEGDGWRIDSVTTWWYNWDGFNDWGSVLYMRFKVYRDSTIISPHPVNSPFIDIAVPPSNYTYTNLTSVKCKVDMELPVSVELPGDTIFWIEVQPVNIYSVNGRTGWMGSSGCGNGKEFYIRFPEAGYPEWTSARDIWVLDTMEVSMVLIGDLISGIPEDIEGKTESLILSVDQSTDPGGALISYSVSKSGPATLKIYDILGKSTRTLVDRANETPGIKTVYWDYKNGNGVSVANGVYLIRLESDNNTATQKMILAR